LVGETWIVKKEKLVYEGNKKGLIQLELPLPLQ